MSRLMRMTLQVNRHIIQWYADLLHTLCSREDDPGRNLVETIQEDECGLNAKESRNYFK
jgi:hypothetical protein